LDVLRSGRTDDGGGRADDDGGARAEAPRLGQLALQRAARVVGVGRAAHRTKRGHQREHAVAGSSRVAGEEDVDRLFGRRVDTSVLEREQQPFDPGAEADPRSVLTADLLDQAVVTTAGADRALRAVLGPDELEDRPGVVVEAA